MGRTNLSGPAAGFYTTFTIHVDDLDSGAGETDTAFRWLAPFDFRTVEIAHSCHARGAGNPIISIRNISAPETQLTNTTPTVLNTTPDVFTPTTSNFLVNRDIHKGDLLQIIVNVSTNATTVDGVCMTMTVYTKSHVVASAAND